MLNLWRISLREDTLGIIGSCCPKLQKLIVAGCRGVNDISIKLLVKKGSDGQCILKHLKEIDVLETDVGLSGIEHVLTSIPTITHINCGGRVLPVALKLLRRGSVAPPFHLKKLDAKYLASLFCSEENPTGFPLDMSAFANVKILAITLEYRKELELLKCFYSLQNLDKLTLQLYYFYYSPPESLDDDSDGKMKVIPFEPHLSGLIQNIGGSLKELCLETASQISFLTIGQSCPNLHRLDVSFRYVKPEMNVSDRQNCFQHVEYLSLRQRRHGSRPEGISAAEYEDFFLGLLSPMHKLNNLYMECIKLGNRFLLNLTSRNPLTHLEYLWPCGCVDWGLGMTNSDLLMFIADRPRLYQFGIKVGNGLRQQCKARGWDIQFHPKVLSVYWPGWPGHASAKWSLHTRVGHCVARHPDTQRPTGHSLRGRTPGYTTSNRPLTAWTDTRIHNVQQATHCVAGHPDTQRPTGHSLRGRTPGYTTSNRPLTAWPDTLCRRASGTQEQDYPPPLPLGTAAPATARRETDRRIIGDHPGAGVPTRWKR